MTTGRANHTATRLADGRVLLVGGFDASAELYDPAIGAFSLTGSLPAALGSQTATLLADGRVLTTGGATLTTPSAGAQVYDPKTGRFSPTGSMTTERTYGHTATLLGDGRVLIVGGWSRSGTLASAETYDPATGRFSPTSSMATARNGHTATLLADGRVLVAGGWGPSGTVLSSAEIYDPKTGTFSPTGSMHDPRGNFTGTLLADGRVLVAGGWSGNDSLASAEVYDPQPGAFTTTGSMAAARNSHTATLLTDSRVLIVGGIAGASSASLASDEVYDPMTGAFSATGSMAAARNGHTATLLADGRVLVAGGTASSVTGFASLASAELYDPETGTFSATGAHLPTIGAAADDGARIVNVATVDARTRDLTIDSPAAGGFVKVRLLIPGRYAAQPATRWPVLYLLCGGAGDHTDWTQQTDVEKLTAPTDLLVVMPDAGQNGYYTDWWNGGAGGQPKWETFHLVELVQLLERNWHAGDRRAIAGLSNGGLGAMNYAARHPGMFLAAASFSGVLDPVAAQASGWGLPVDVWGDPSAQADIWRAHDPTANAAALKGVALYVAHGNGQPGPLDAAGASATGDDNAAVSDSFVTALDALHIPVTVYAYGNGTHSWPYWQRDLHRWLPLALKVLGG